MVLLLSRGPEMLSRAAHAKYNIITSCVYHVHVSINTDAIDETADNDL